MHIHCSSIQPLAAPPTKRSRGELKDPTGTAEKKKAQAMQQHLDREFRGSTNFVKFGPDRI